MWHSGLKIHCRAAMLPMISGLFLLQPHVGGKAVLVRRGLLVAFSCFTMLTFWPTLTPYTAVVPTGLPWMGPCHHHHNLPYQSYHHRPLIISMSVSFPSPEEAQRPILAVTLLTAKGPRDTTHYFEDAPSTVPKYLMISCANTELNLFIW